jgi:hypothetical protein
METIAQIFYPLSLRLKLLENPDECPYINRDGEMMVWTNYIEVHLDRFHPEDIRKYLEVYSNRITNTLQLFPFNFKEWCRTPKSRTYLHIQHIPSESRQKASSKDKKEYLKELNFYKDWIHRLRQLREPATKRDNERNKLQPFILSKKMSTLEFRKNGFKPKFSAIQAALFLNYLIENGIVPNYVDDDFADLVKVLLARDDTNAKRISKNVDSYKKSGHLKGILINLKSLIEMIQSDLEYEDRFTPPSTH